MRIIAQILALTLIPCSFRQRMPFQNEGQHSEYDTAGLNFINRTSRHTEAWYSPVVFDGLFTDMVSIIVKSARLDRFKVDEACHCNCKLQSCSGWHVEICLSQC